MAIYHLTHRFLRRSMGASSVAKAAYNAGEKLEDAFGLSVHSDYTHKSGVLHEEITLPKGSPVWASNRGEFWRRLEWRENKSTRPSQAVLAHNFDIALPHELNLEQLTFLARDFVREQFTRKGYVADWSIHAPDPRGDSRNIHLHILVPLRKITEDGNSFGNKLRYNKGELVQQTKNWRKAWTALANRHLKRYGHKVEIDHRTLKAQGSKKIPTRHRGKRPKSNHLYLNKLKAKLPPYPQRPRMHTTKHVRSDGSIVLKTAITGSALNGVGVRAVRDSGNAVHETKPSALRPVERKNQEAASVSTIPRIQPETRNSAPSSASAPKASLHGRNPLSVPVHHHTSNTPPPTQFGSSGLGWPAEAIADWRDWGQRSPQAFFTKWPELSSGHFHLKGGLTHD